MKRSDDNAYTVGVIVFGLFCLFVVFTGIVYVAALNNQTPTLTDTYGTTQNPTTNASQSAVTAMTAEEEASMIPLLLLACAVALCAIIFIVWVASKSGIHV